MNATQILRAWSKHGYDSRRNRRSNAEQRRSGSFGQPHVTNESSPGKRAEIMASSFRTVRDETMVRLPSPIISDQTVEKQYPPKRVMIADDDATVRGSLAAVLEAEGYTVLQAENGQQALNLIDTHPVDLVLLDLNMPVRNGWDSFEELTGRHPTVPVIIITARPNQVFTAMSAGAGALLEKPMEIPKLLQAMERLLAESSEQRLARFAGKKSEFYYQPARLQPSTRSKRKE